MAARIAAPSATHHECRDGSQSHSHQRVFVAMRHAFLRVISALSLVVPAPTIAQQPSARDTIAFAQVSIDLRDQPRDSATVIALLPKGARLQLRTCVNGWCGVRAGQTVGYAKQDSLGSVAPATSPTGKGYTNSNGEWVPSPQASPSGPPSGASAQCRDGTYSFSRSRRGTCSHHGGVSRWL